MLRAITHMQFTEMFSESDLKEEPEEDPADYPADRDDDDEEEEDPFRDDADDEDEDEDEDEEEEEHPAPADSVPPAANESAESRDTVHLSSITTTYIFTTLAVTIFLLQSDGPRYTTTVGRVTKLTIDQESDTRDIYAVIEDTQDRQTQIYQSVRTLVDGSQYNYETARLLDQEALVSREAWGCSIETQMAEFQRQLGPAKGPAQPDAPGELYHIHDLVMFVNAALAARDATRNDDDSHTSGTGARRPVQVARECTYPDFLKCQLHTLNFKDAIEFATELMDKKINTWAERQADNKRKSDDLLVTTQNPATNNETKTTGKSLGRRKL
ncbi:hypothetical protein Tco_1355391 [Tanacetum coccineum]